jgi:DNA repair protein RadD
MVTGETPTAEREAIIRAFKSGKLRALTNSNIFTTGFDAPGIDLIALLRPTASISLYVQMLGRGTRLAEGKDNCLVLDFAGNTVRHGPLDMVDGRRKGEKGEAPPPTKTCPDCETICFAGCRECPDCGHVFPPPPLKISRTAISAPILSNQVQDAWVDVAEVYYYRHEKEGRPPSLRVEYQCGLVRHREWIALELTGYPRQKACAWWQRRAPAIPVPTTVDDALAHAHKLAKPTAIRIKPVGKYTEITGAKFT